MSKTYINDGSGNREATQEEIDAIYAQHWSKEVHIAEINRLHQEEFDRRLFAAEYVGKWELNAVLADPTNVYYNEAKELIAYWWNGWDAIKAYGETVTEETAQDPIAFTLSI